MNGLIQTKTMENFWEELCHLAFKMRRLVWYFSLILRKEKIEWEWAKTKKPCRREKLHFRIRHLTLWIHWRSLQAYNHKDERKSIKQQPLLKNVEMDVFCSNDGWEGCPWPIRVQSIVLTCTQESSLRIKLREKPQSWHDQEILGG